MAIKGNDDGNLDETINTNGVYHGARACTARWPHLPLALGPGSWSVAAPPPQRRLLSAARRTRSAPEVLGEESDDRRWWGKSTVKHHRFKERTQTQLDHKQQDLEVHTKEKEGERGGERGREGENPKRAESFNPKVKREQIAVADRVFKLSCSGQNMAGTCSGQKSALPGFTHAFPNMQSHQNNVDVSQVANEAAKVDSPPPRGVVNRNQIGTRQQRREVVRTVYGIRCIPPPSVSWINRRTFTSCSARSRSRSFAR